MPPKAVEAPPPVEEAPASEPEPEPEPLPPGLVPERIESYFALADDPEAAAKFLAAPEVLDLPQYTTDARSAARLDYVAGMLECAKAAKLSPVQAAELCTLGEALLACSVSGRPQAEGRELLCSALLERCGPAPRPDEPKFSPEHVSRISQFFAQTYFRHYRLYCYAFAHEQGHSANTDSVVTETPVPWPAMESAMTEEQWAEYQAELAAKAEAERRAIEEAEKARLDALEAERLAREKAEFEAARAATMACKPATVEQAVEKLVMTRLEEEKAALAAEYQRKEDELLARIAELQAAAAAAAGGGKKK